MKPVELVRWAFHLTLANAGPGASRCALRSQGRHRGPPADIPSVSKDSNDLKGIKRCKKVQIDPNFIKILQNANHLADPVQLVREALLAEFKHLTMEIQ